MYKNARIIIISSIIVLVAGLAIVRKHKLTENKNVLTIGILQTITHPALDQAREGFVKTVQQELGAHNVDCIVQNAQGNVANAQTIAQSYHANENVDAIYAIGTLATQAIATIEKQKPIMIAAVTDPWALGLAHATTNVCGTSDMIDAVAQAALIKELLPNVKTVAIPYSTGEINSITQVKAMKKALTAVGIQPIEIGITHESEIPTALQIACKKTDAILTPTDNAVVAAMSLVVSIANSHKKPLIVSDSPSINAGALAVLGIDYYQSGVAAAHKAIKVLVKKEAPAKVCIAKAAENKVILNRKTIEELNISVPAELAARAEYV